MGEPYKATPADRLAVRRLASSILSAIRSDSEVDLGLDRSDPADHAHGRCVRRADVLDLVAKLAGEVCQLEGERGARAAIAGRLEDWTHRMGAELCPRGADTYGEGKRDAKDEVSRILRSKP